MPETAREIEQAVMLGVSTRELSGSLEVREPPPLTIEQVEEYRTALQGMPYPQLAQQLELFDRSYSMLEPALPDWRLDLSMYPHPVVQKRLLILNEMYKRAVSTPKIATNYHQTRTMVEWAFAGSVVGGLIGQVTKEQLWTGALAGAVLGGIAGRSSLLQTVLMEFSSKAAMF